MLKECKSWFVSRRLIQELKCSLLLSSLALSHNEVFLLISSQHLDDLDCDLTESSQIHRFHWQNYNSETQKYLQLSLKFLKIAFIQMSRIAEEQHERLNLNISFCSWNRLQSIQSLISYFLLILLESFSLLIVSENLTSVSVMTLESDDSCFNISDSRLFSVSQHVERHTFSMIMNVCINLYCRIKHKDYSCHI